MIQEIVKKIAKLQKDIEKDLKLRKDYYLSKPESWQDSMAGDKYQNNSDRIQEMCDLLSEARTL